MTQQVIRMDCWYPFPPQVSIFAPRSFLDTELQHIRNALPDEVVVQRIDERLSSLGNLIACNDHVALLHTDLDRVVHSWECSSRKRKKSSRMCWAWKCSVSRSLETLSSVATASSQIKEVWCTPALRWLRRKSCPLSSRFRSLQEL